MSRRKLLAPGISLLALGLVGCNLAEPPVFDPQFIQQMERNRVLAGEGETLPELPTTRQTPAWGEAPAADQAHPDAGLNGEQIVKLSLQEVIHRAVANNHDVHVAGFQTAINGAQTIEAEAHFDPAFFMNSQYTQKNEATAGQIFDTFPKPPLLPTPFTAFFNKSFIDTFQTGFKQNLESGGQVQLQFEESYNFYSPQQFKLNPFYESNVSLQLTQPLLRNYGSDVNRARITITRYNQQVSLLDFRKAIEKNVSDCEKAYWQLVEATRDVEIAENLVGVTEATHNILFGRIKVDVSDLQLAQAQTSLESRRATLVAARTQQRDLSDQIKQLMSDPEFPVASPIVILPADAPVLEPLKFDLRDQINTALDNRLELGQQQLKVKAASTTVTVARNNLLPQLDAIINAGFDGVAHNNGDALSQEFGIHHVDAGAGFKFEIPLGNREARAIYKRTLLQRMEAMEQYKALVELVTLDVTTGARGVESAWARVVDQRRSRFAAELALEKIADREKANEPLTPTFVQLKLDIQNSLSQSEQEEARAVSDYNFAISQLEKAKGTLLRYNNVIMQEAPSTPADSGLLR